MGSNPTRATALEPDALISVPPGRAGTERPAGPGKRPATFAAAALPGHPTLLTSHTRTLPVSDRRPVTKTTLARMGVSQWSADTDLWPGREGTNADLAAINNNAAVYLQGLMSARPSPAFAGRYFWATDTSRLWYDNGASWIEVSPIGGGGNPTSIDIGDAAAEGSSRIAARADHQHPFPAPSVAPGVLAYGGSGTIGSASTPARADHSHTVPALPLATGAPGTVTFGSAGAAGQSVAVARADHTHSVDLTAHDAYQTFTPTLRAGTGALSGTENSRGLYRRTGNVVEVFVHVGFSSSVNGGSGPIYVDLPVAAASNFAEQYLGAKLWTPQYLDAQGGDAATWLGQGFITAGESVASLLFPTAVDDVVGRSWRNQGYRNNQGPGTGIPRIPGQYGVQPGGRVSLQGSYVAA